MSLEVPRFIMRSHPGNSRFRNSGTSPREILLWRAFKAMLAIAAWTAAIFALISLYQDSADRAGYDFYQFWVGGDVLRTRETIGHGRPIDLYSDAAFHDIGQRYELIAKTRSRLQRKAASEWHVLYTASSPFFYWVFSVAMPGDYERMFHAYRFVALACLVGSISAVGWRLRYSVAGIGAAVALAALSGPVFCDFNVTNINCPQLAACVAYLFLRDAATRSSLFAWSLQGIAGLIMGMLIAFKPNLLLVPLLLGFSGLASGRKRAVVIESVGVAIGLTAAIAVSSWRFGSVSCWLNWARDIRELGTRLSMQTIYGNISLSRTLFELTGRNLFAAVATLFMALAIGAIWLGRRHAQSRAVSEMPSRDAVSDPPNRDIEFWRDLTIFGIAETMTFMISGLAWLHYPILILPFLMLIVSRGISKRIARGPEIVRYLLATIVIVLLMFPLARQIQSLLPLRLEILALTWVRFTQIAILIIFGIGLWFESRVLPRVRT